MNGGPPGLVNAVSLLGRQCMRDGLSRPNPHDQKQRTHSSIFARNVISNHRKCHSLTGLVQLYELAYLAWHPVEIIVTVVLFIVLMMLPNKTMQGDGSGWCGLSTGLVPAILRLCNVLLP